jgi:hypothetical protein
MASRGTSTLVTSETVNARGWLDTFTARSP